MVLLVPVPEIEPGLITQLPDGKPLNSTLPVATAQLGCVINPTIGIDGDSGCLLITTSVDGAELQPSELVTIKL